jgi:hypothetical protein
MADLIYELTRIKTIMGLTENIAQAEKFLKSNDFSLEDPTYVGLRQELYDLRLNGYAIFIIRATFNNGKIDIAKVRELIDALIANKEVLGNLPKNVINYTNYEEFMDDIGELVVNRDIKKLINLVSSNKILKKALEAEIDYLSSREMYAYIKYFISAPAENKKDLLTKINKHKTLDSFITELKSFVEDLKIGLTLDTVKKTIEGLGADDIKLLSTDNNMIIARILTYNAAQALGSNSWCITSSLESYTNYTKDGNRLYYFFLSLPVSYQLPSRKPLILPPTLHPKDGKKKPV